MTIRSVNLSKLAILLSLCVAVLLPITSLAAPGNSSPTNFESGNKDGWAEGSSSGAPVIMQALYGGLAHSGQWMAWLGGENWISEGIVAFG